MISESVPKSVVLRRGLRRILEALHLACVRFQDANLAATGLKFLKRSVGALRLKVQGCGERSLTNEATGPT